MKSDSKDYLVQTQRRLPSMHVDKLLLGINTVNNQRYLNLQIENEKDKALALGGVFGVPKLPEGFNFLFGRQLGIRF